MVKKVQVAGSVVAGFPSPAEQYLEPPLNLNELPVKRPAAIYQDNLFAHACREKICPVEASLVGSDPTLVKKLRIIVGGRVRCVITAGPTLPGIDPVCQEEMGVDWASRLKSPGKWYYFFEVSELRAVSDRVDG